MCKSKVCIGLLAAVLLLVAGMLMGFSGPQEGLAPTAAMAAPASHQTERLQTYVYWPIWRSGS